MPATPIVVTMDADADPVGAAKFAKVFLELGVEATLMLSGPTAKSLAADHPLTDVLKRLDAGLVDRELAEPEASSPKLFGPRFESLHDPLLFVAGRLPTVYGCPGFAHGAYATLSEVNIRAVLPAEPIAPTKNAFFLGGRLHLPPAIPVKKLASDADVESVFHRVTTEVDHDDVSAPVVIGLHGVATAVSESALGTLLRRLKEPTSFAVGSVRQAADLFADIPYDHAIPMAAITAMAADAAKGDLGCHRYALGCLSPAEQLFILTHCWAASLEKGKPPRNSQTRTPIPTLEDPAVSTATISAAELPSLIAKLKAAMEGKNELPAAVQLEAGVVAVQDLLPTLAASLSSMPTPTDLAVVKGAAMFTPEAVGFGRLAWTYKPATQ